MRRAVYGEREPEGAALPGGAVHADLAAHQGHELFGDRESEPGAAVAPRGRTVGLSEGLEDRLLRVGFDPDSRVAHLEAQLDRVRGVVVPGERDGDLAGRGELDRVVGQIRQHLANAFPIAAHDYGQARVNRGNQLNALV